MLPAADLHTERRQPVLTIPATRPVIGFAAHSGSGKTTLLVKLIAIFRQKGIRTGVIKHSHHEFTIDHPGKDSYEIRHAGASQVLIGTNRQWALMSDSSKDLSLSDYLQYLQPDELDLIVVEGYKHEAIPKIEIYRPELGLPLLSQNDESFIAIATNNPDGISARQVILNLDRPDQIAGFIIDRILKPVSDTADK